MCLQGGCGACIVNISGIKTPSGDSKTIAVNSVRSHNQKIDFLLKISSSEILLEMNNCSVFG